MPSTPASTGAVPAIARDPAIVTVIERFDAPKDRQAEAVGPARSRIAQAWTGDPDFVGAALPGSRVHGGVSVHAQWRRPAGGAAPLAPPAGQALGPAMAGFGKDDRYREGVAEAEPDFLDVVAVEARR